MKAGERSSGLKRAHFCDLFKPVNSPHQADPFIAELVSRNASQTDQLKPQQTSILTRRMHGHDVDVISRVKGKKSHLRLFKNKKEVQFENYGKSEQYD